MTPVIVVAGLGRCGSSLTMQMLHAAGVPTVGTFPDFEERGVRARPGQAVKWLDPQDTPRPFRARAVCIWLDRDPGEQAKSQAKFLRHLVGLDVQWRQIEAGLRWDRPAARCRIARWPTLTMTFEALVTEPRGQAERIAQFLKRWYVLDADAMAACVLPRGPECLSDLAVELQLVRGSTT